MDRVDMLLEPVRVFLVQVGQFLPTLLGKRQVPLDLLLSQFDQELRDDVAGLFEVDGEIGKFRGASGLLVVWPDLRLFQPPLRAVRHL